MTKEEYHSKIKALEEEHERAKKRVMRDYAFSHNPYKEGDIVGDSLGSIRIEKIQFIMPFMEKEPSCVYSGRTLKKDGTPTKKEEIRKVYQGNIEE